MENPFEEVLKQLAEIKELILAIQRPEPPNEIIDRKELQKRLQLAEPTIINWGKRKIIPFFRIGSAVRYNWPKVVKAIENNKLQKQQEKKEWLDFVEQGKKERKEERLSRPKRNHSKEYRENLLDPYVKQKLSRQTNGTLKASDFPKEIVESKRNILKLKRTVNDNS